MKILLAAAKATHTGGGIVSYNQELLNLYSKEHEIHLLTDANEHDVPGFRSSLSTYGHSNSDFIFALELVGEINSKSYDIIINSGSNFIPVLSPFLTSPIISVSHFVNGKLAINAGYNAEYLSKIVALSNYGKDFLQKKFKINEPEKVQVVYNFVKHLDKLLNTEEKITRRPLRIVYPGGTSIEKSVDVIQSLIYKLLDSDLQFEFYWIGTTRLPSANMSFLGLRNTVDLFKKDTRLHITGMLSREDAESIIGSANIFLLPSRGEGCPMTLLEAMRGGCIPIVSDAKHGSREIIEQSGAGIIVKQNSSDELYKTIKDIILNHNKYQSLYSDSANYMSFVLSQEEWSRQMTGIIHDAVRERKKIMQLTKDNFKKSYLGFSRLYKIDRIKKVCRSAYYRLKFDFTYLFH